MKNELQPLRLFSPLFPHIYRKNEWGDLDDYREDLCAGEVLEYEDKILALIQKEKLPSEGELWGVTEVQTYGTLSPSELAELTDWLSSQFSDGWGEGRVTNSVVHTLTRNSENELYRIEQIDLVDISLRFNADIVVSLLLCLMFSTTASQQIKTVVNKAVFPAIDLILAVFFFAKLGTCYFEYRKHGQMEWAAPAILFACLVFTLTAPLYIWTILGM